MISPTELDLHRLDDDAVRAVERLQSRGLEAYLVGGCVRDLLLDRAPKDYDIATSARPQQIKRVFPRNCRIIGRRFKLAHLHFDQNRKILEVSTFRRTPVSDQNGDSENGAHAEAGVTNEDGYGSGDGGSFDSRAFDGRDDADDDSGDFDEARLEGSDDGDESREFEDREGGDATHDSKDDDSDGAGGYDAEGTRGAASRGARSVGDPEDNADLLITRDNEFGTAQEDATRRDFTVNALFLDPIRDEIIDYVGGLADVEARVIRTIGDPIVRFREDPVRILRAIKFSTRLGFSIDPATFDAMVEVVPDLVRSAPPRLLEELLRLLRGGHALDAFQLLRDIGALAILMPIVDDYLGVADAEERARFWRLLEALDGLVQRRGGRPPSNGVMLGALFARPVLFAAAQTGQTLHEVTEELVQPFAAELRLPRRDTGCVKRVCSVHPRFLRDDPRRGAAGFASGIAAPPAHVRSGRHRRSNWRQPQDHFFGESLELFGLLCAASGENLDCLDEWQSAVRGAGSGASVAEAPATRERRDAPRAEQRERDDRTSVREARDGKRKKRKGRADRTDRADRPRGQPDRAIGEQRPEAPKPPAKSRDKRERRGKKPGKERKIEIETIEPEAIDLSAFDVELSPRRAPSFGTIVEAGAAKKKKRPAFSFEDDSYRPPPPPGDGSTGGAPDSPTPPPPAAPEDFNDW